MTSVETPPRLQPLVADDLVDDRALADRADDAFRLADFVDELAALCRATRVPANIALFGPWGSGKTSLANLLESHFKNDRTIAFARFDAFKYAEKPLRRHFLSQVAKSFRIEKSDYSRDLYRGKRTTHFRIPAEGLLRLLIVLAVAVSFATLLMAIIAALIAWPAKGDFTDEFTKTLRVSAPGILLTSGVLTALLAFIGKAFTLDVTEDLPSSDEEFERLFAQLVGDILAKTRAKRIVILIDELDRCGPGEVVTVLETLRTFLDINPCIFIVTADQQAIEAALSEEARQATPVDVANPYYSAASSYLDKIFQYQLALPPLLSRTLSRFALDLVTNRGGVWSAVANKPELVTVLVPTHVRSPRRVKILLNAFALSFRLALRRSEEGTLDENVQWRASEIAKLVCLRTEFPLFANDLRLDARLPEVTLRLAREPELTLKNLGVRGFSEEAFGRAKAYALGRLPLDELLTSDEEDGSARDLAEEQGRARDEGDETDGVRNGDEERVSADASHNVVRSHARQLLRYLERTEAVHGPSRDLVFLEASGAAFGLPAELAETLEEDAMDGAASAVASTVADLSDDDQHRAFQLLARLIVERIGLEAENARHCLFQALPVATTPLEPVADEILAALVTAREPDELATSDLLGAFRLSLLRQTPQAIELRRRVLERDELTSSREVGLAMLAEAGRLTQQEQTLLAPILAARILDTDTSELLSTLLTDANTARP